MLMQMVPVLDVTPTERKLPAVQAFIRTEEYKMHVEDTEVCVANIIHNVINVVDSIGCVCSDLFNDGCCCLYVWVLLGSTLS